MQEKLLSTRLLHFTENELSWECVPFAHCEYCLEPHHDTLVTAGGIWLKDLRGQSIWSAMIENYTQRQLTYARDELSALTGQAIEVQNYCYDRYLTGFWEGDLPWHLSWSVKRPDYGTRVYSLIAPLWSWACLIGKSKL